MSGSILSLLSLFQGGAGLDELVRHTVIIAEILNVQAPDVRRVDNAIHWINLYKVDSSVRFGNSYPVDSELSVG